MGDDGGRQGNQSDLYESEVVIEAESREASHALNMSEGEEGHEVGCERVIRGHKQGAMGGDSMTRRLIRFI